MHRVKQQSSTVSVEGLARYRMGVFDRPLNAGDYVSARLCEIGGCEECGESVGADRAFVTSTGYLRCADCIGDDGWTDTSAANAALFGGSNG